VRSRDILYYDNYSRSTNVIIDPQVMGGIASKKRHDLTECRTGNQQCVMYYILCDPPTTGAGKAVRRASQEDGRED